jgi:hypothetical protein
MTADRTDDDHRPRGRYEADPGDQCSRGGDCQPVDGVCQNCGNPV